MAMGDPSYTSRTPRSRELFERARKVIPGGTSYSNRFFPPYPFYVSRARGSHIWDVDGNEYVDYWMVHWGAVFGHAYPPIVRAAVEQVEEGAHIGWSTEWEVKWAEAVAGWFEAERVKPANSGTEANMYAVRLAQAFTGRKKVAKVEGGWHGGFDRLQKAVSYPYDKPASLGLQRDRATVVIPFNDLDGAAKILKKERPACVLIEPMLGAAGAIPAEPEFLKGLRELCDGEGMLLIFDEVITGPRHPGGLQKLYGVKPDLTTLGKGFGGQYFAGAGGICGRAEVMDLLNHVERPKFWQRSFLGGTFVGNPLSMRVGYTFVRELEARKDVVYGHIDGLGEGVRRGLREVLEDHNFEAYVTGLGSLIGLHFTKEMPRDGRTAARTKDVKLCQRFFLHMLERGIAYLTPTSIHFAISTAHTKEEAEGLVMGLEAFLSGGEGVAPARP